MYAIAGADRHQGRDAVDLERVDRDEVPQPRQVLLERRFVEPEVLGQHRDQGCHARVALQPVERRATAGLDQEEHHDAQGEQRHGSVHQAANDVGQHAPSPASGELVAECTNRRRPSQHFLDFVRWRPWVHRHGRTRDCDHAVRPLCTRDGGAPRGPSIFDRRLVAIDLEVDAIPVFDVPGVTRLGRVVLDASELIAPPRCRHETGVQRDEDHLVGQDRLGLVDERQQDRLVNRCVELVADLGEPLRVLIDERRALGAVLVAVATIRRTDSPGPRRP